MANYKRGYPRTSGRAHGASRGYWLRHWPKWWDVVYHTRPHRREAAAVTNKVVRGVLDADAAVWPVSKKPHLYYW